MDICFDKAVGVFYRPVYMALRRKMHDNIDPVFFHHAKDLYRTLVERDLLNVSGAPTYKFVATGDTDSFNKLARRFLGPEVHSVEGAI